MQDDTIGDAARGLKEEARAAEKADNSNAVDTIIIMFDFNL